MLFAALCVALFTGSAEAQSANREMLVSTGWLAKNLDRVILLHVGANRQSYDSGHIPTARFLAYSDITTTRDGVPNELASVENLQKAFSAAGVGNSKRIVLYGDLNGLAAARTFFTLDYLGHSKRVSVLNGGLEKWKSEKRELSTAAATQVPEPFVATIDPQTVIGIDTVRDVSWSVINQSPSNFSLIDARPPEEYRGEKPGDGIVRPGHIPGSINVFWLANNIVSRENPIMKPDAELRRIYAAAGVARNKTNVVYCRTGGQASHTYFTLRYLGYRVKMYDGSFFQWNKQADTTVAR
ncbi:MAG: sulfurtransferase [Acidobacteria bacterium]|nr:sulfurtransferase [Acidobacteriota bacterium]